MDILKELAFRMSELNDTLDKPMESAVVMKQVAGLFYSMTVCPVSEMEKIKEEQQTEGLKPEIIIKGFICGSLNPDELIKEYHRAGEGFRGKTYRYNERYRCYKKMVA